MGKLVPIRRGGLQPVREQLPPVLGARYEPHGLRRQKRLEHDSPCCVRASQGQVGRHVVGLYKLNADDPELESAWFQPLNEPIK
jgi:hypothetical protein